MPKRTKEDAELTRSRLLDAAADVFCRNGVADTTLEEVATAAGMTRGAIYWHFKNKGALLDALWDEAGSPERGPRVEEVRRYDEEPLSHLRSRALETLTDATTRLRTRQVWTLLFHKTEQGATTLTERMLASRRDCRKGVEKLFRAAKAAGELHESLNVRVVTSAYFSYLDGLIYDWLQDPAAFNMKRDAEQAVDIFFRGLAR